MAYSYSKSKGSDGRYLSFSESTASNSPELLMGFVSRHHDSRHYWSRVFLLLGAVILVIILGRWFEIDFPLMSRTPVLSTMDDENFKVRLFFQPGPHDIHSLT